MPVPIISPPAKVEEALSLIEGAGLPHPLDLLLSSFVHEALDPRLAADFVLHRCPPGPSLQADLLSLVLDWTSIVEAVFEHGQPPPAPDKATQATITGRDGSRCCIIGKPAGFRDPLLVLPILPLPCRWAGSKPSIHDMLGAFLTPPYRDWWLAYIRNPSRMNHYHSHWLVRASAARAFSDGLVRLDRLLPSVVEYEAGHVVVGKLDGDKLISFDGCYPLLGDHSRRRVDTVDPRFVGTHARLCESYRWLDIIKSTAITKEISQSLTLARPSQATVASPSSPLYRRSFSILGLVADTCLALWLMVPGSARLATYRLLRRAGRRMYGSPGGFGTVQRLPFGLYLKHGSEPESFRNEYNALVEVRKYTSIPVPRPIDMIPVPTKSTNMFAMDDAYLVTTRMPGTALAMCQELLLDKDAAGFVDQMQDYVAQLRAIPKTIAPEHAICNTLGGPCRDPRIRSADPVGPFADEAAFSQVLRNPDEPARRGHRVFFTHADLNTRNILVDRVTGPDGSRSWKVTGIVDWENSGYYPEYWEYIKALFESFRYTNRWCRIYHDIFRPFGDYTKELEVEQRSRGEGAAI